MDPLRAEPVPEEGVVEDDRGVPPLVAIEEMSKEDILDLKHLTQLYEHPGWAVFQRLLAKRLEKLGLAWINDDEPTHGKEYYRGCQETILSMPEIARQAAEDYRMLMDRDRVGKEMDTSLVSGIGDGDLPT